MLEVFLTLFLRNEIMEYNMMYNCTFNSIGNEKCSNSFTPSF